MIRLNFTLPIAGPVTAVIENDPQSCQIKNDNIQLVVFVVDRDGTAINMLSASFRKIKLLSPKGTTIEKDAEMLTSGVDGALEYTTTKDDLKDAGTYQIQAEFVLGGNLQTTRWGTFRAGQNIDD